MRSALSFAMGIALALVAPAALAQDNQAGVSGSVGGSAQLPPPAVAAPAPAPPPTAVAPSSTARVEPADDGISDHEKYAVGHFALGYLGFTTIPLDGAPNGVAAPVVGVRYWLNEKIGLDLGAGLALTGGSTETTDPTTNTTTTTDKAGVFGLAVHGGVPIALAHQKHYKFLVIPELNVAFAHQSEAVVNQNDISHNGFHLDVGARAGAEIHFGFIGIPQLALQATIGAFLRTDHTSRSQDVANGTIKASDSTTSLGTSVQSDPWALFVNNISALYYFP